MWCSRAPCCRGRPGACLLRSPERACGPAPLEGSAHTSPPLAGLPVLHPTSRSFLRPGVSAWSLEGLQPPAEAGEREAMSASPGGRTP